LDTYPHIQLIFTASTLTGFQTAERIFAKRDIDLAYFPYDWIVSIRAVAAKINPHAVIIIETDIWPNFLIEMHRRCIPVYLVNMRLSDRAFRTYRHIKSMAGRLFGTFDTICAQTEQDAMRLCRLGVDPKRVVVTGNIKFDDVDQQNSDDIPDNWRLLKQAARQRQVVVAGSTHNGEEAALIDALRSVEDKMEPPLLIIAPRDPDRSKQVLALCKRDGRRCCRLSDLLDGQQNQQPHVIVADFLGALKQLYGLADIAFVGGSLVSEGGHNPLEPAAWGKPVLFGPDMRDFHEIACWLIEAGGARQVAGKDRLGPLMFELLSSPALAKTIGGCARTVFLSNKGAVTKTLSCLDPSLRDFVEPHR
jgi:3-deoxy-D-manno-octulosonic-acid transferase